MSDESERLKKLRERQLADRDPMVKIRKGQQHNAERERKIDRSVSLLQAWRDIPRIWRSVVWAFLIAGAGLAILPNYLDMTTSLFGAIAIALAYLIIAILIGNALDARDELRRLSK